ncbi:MAG: EAL domain-containing protein, partial [Pseudomonadota bacterium]
KIVNDTSGHAAGDALLKAVTRILQRSVRGNDVIGRLGGDEFAILLRRCPEENARRIAEAVRADIAALPFSWQGERHAVGASVGIALLDRQAESLADIRQLADAACYAAKRGGRNRVHVASRSDHELVAHRGTLLWAPRIKDAIENDHFVLYAQQIASARPDTQGRDHVEILLRLADPQTGKLIAPGEFLPAAERYGLAQQVDLWVIRRLVHLLDTQAIPTDTRYWVNLSGASIGDAAFGSELRKLITDAGIRSGTLNFEITETAVIRNLRRARELMVRLHGLGALFALDDFGTGLSSYSHLKALPVDHVKIDGSFIRNVASDTVDRAFVRSITDVAQTMGLRVVAEFVEDDATRKVVAELGADFVQGYGIHRPEALAIASDPQADATQLASG